MGGERHYGSIVPVLLDGTGRTGMVPKKAGCIGSLCFGVAFSVAYGSDLHFVSQIVEDAVNNIRHKWTDPKKKVKTVVAQMGDSSVDFKLYVWADAVKKVYVISDVLNTVYSTLRANGVEIPFPQRDIPIK